MLAFRRTSLLAAAALVLLVLLALVPHRAAASTRQYAMIEDDTAVLSNPSTALSQMRSLGASVVRVFLPWRTIAPAGGFTSKPGGFNAADPRSYPQQNWAVFDTIDRLAQSDGLQVEFVITGPVPAWAEGPHPQGNNEAWEPSAAEYRSFVTATGRRYSGRWVPNGEHSALPPVRHWEIWNEPNFGSDLGPQALNGSRLPVAPMFYRNLLNAAWSGLRATGHAHDTITIGQLSARGEAGVGTARNPAGYPGIDGQTKPLVYIRELYCLDNKYRLLRGRLAAQEGCPTSTSASRAFARRYPALFNSSGFGIHPYPQGLPPTRDSSRDRDFVTFNKIPVLEKVLDKVTSTYHSHKKFAIYNNEYGYITDPPNRLRVFASPAVAAIYINWAEYLSWRNPRIATTMQYLLYDPNPYHAPEYGGFASGLFNSSFVDHGAPKATYYAYRMPVFMPVTRSRRGRTLEIWGAARPAPAAASATHRTQTVQIQFAAGRSRTFKTIRTIADKNRNGYFDVHLAFKTSGTLRIAYTDPVPGALTYTDPLGGQAIYSRQVPLTIH